MTDDEKVPHDEVADRYEDGIVTDFSTRMSYSSYLGLDMLLGAFAAGVIFRLLLAGAPERDVEAIEGKLEGIGYGLLVPVFFILTGVTFDLEALVASPATIALLPIFLVLLLVVRGIPATLAAPSGATRRDRVAIGLLEQHIDHCVVHAAAAGDEEDAKAKVAEATRAIERLVRS